MVLRRSLALSRRDLLVSMLGAGAWAACKSSCAPEIGFDGGFVGPDPALGHRLRSALPPAVPESERHRVLILGGGIAGLAAAWRLERRGITDFLLLELEPTIGGTSTWGARGELRYPWGAHYLPVPHEDEALLELLRETGSLSPGGELEETHLVADPSERVYFRGFWYEGLYPIVGASKADLEQHARFDREVRALVNARGEDGRRAFGLPVTACSEDPALLALDAISMARWLDERGFDSPRLRWYVEYACRDDYGATLEDTSAWAGLLYFVARLSTPEAESAEYLTWPEGNGFLVEHLARRFRERIRTGTLVTRVEPARVHTLDARGPGCIGFDRAIFALPSFLRRPLLGLEDYSPDVAPWLVANLHLRDRPRNRGFAPAWDNVIYGSRSLGYVVATHQMQLDRGPTVWTFYLPLTGDPRAQREALLSLDYKEAADVVLTELTRCHPDLPPLVERIDIARWGHAMVRPSPGTIASASRRAAARPIGKLHFAHTDLSGVALFEEAFFHGTRAAEEVLAAS